MEERKLDWLDNFENIVPIRGGRPAAVVNSMGKSATISEAKEKFENDFLAAQDAEDALPIVVDYVRWFECSFPNGRTDVLHPMLYRILTRYGTDDRYRNDERIMKLWLKLADNYPERGFAVMDLAYTRGSCRELAKFYIFWSKMYEYAEQMQKARDILDLGITSRAVPITDIHAAKDEFELRYLSWLMEKERRQAELDTADDDDFGDYDDELDETRNPLSRIPVVSKPLGGFEMPSVRSRNIQLTPVKITAGRGADFDIYVEEESDVKSQPVGKSNWTIPTVEDSLSKDPDYQSIFGYREFPGQHLNILENNPARTGKICGIPELRPSDPLASFSVYCESQKQKPDKAAAAKAKLRFGIRRELTGQLSIEEAFLARLKSQKTPAPAPVPVTVSVATYPQETPKPTKKPRRIIVNENAQ